MVELDYSSRRLDTEAVMSVEVNFMFGGEAGQGLQSVGFILAKAFARGGYHVFADQDYESRIRGGHSFYRVRAGDTPVNAIIEPLDFLLALNRETIDLHRKELRQNGVVIFDPAKITGISGENLFGVPPGEAGGNCRQQSHGQYCRPRLRSGPGELRP